jgi:hypothetical protein
LNSADHDQVARVDLVGASKNNISTFLGAGLLKKINWSEISVI